MAKTIADRLAELSPNKADLFAQKLRAFEEDLDRRMFGSELVEQVGGERLWALELEGKLETYLAEQELADRLGGWLAKMQPLRGRKIITYHRSWSYFANRFGLVVADELEPKPGVPPSPRHLTEVIQRANRENIGVILMEPFYRRKAADFVASKTDAEVLVCAHSVGGQKEAPDYLSLIDLVVSRLTRESQDESPDG
jgi:ABC-type Zn uptake system ZnuABC Zn-binding protein ZnuA